MNEWRSRYGSWEGTASDLADLAERLERKLFPDLPGEATPPNVRLIRGYVTEGVMARAERRGKEAYFGFRQLLELLATRLLIREGWPLPKIAELVRSATAERLVALLPPLEATPAQRLVASFQAPGAARARSAGASPSLGASALNAAKLRGDLVSLGNASGVPGISRAVSIEIAPWCRVIVDAESLRHLDDRAIDRVADAIRTSLARAKLMKGEGR